MCKKFDFGRLIGVFGFTLLLTSNGFSACKPIYGHVGGNPFDYRDPKNRVPNGTFPNGGPIGMVENAHFYPDIELLTRKPKSGLSAIADDLDYTLREIPNHVRALNSASKYEYKQASIQEFRRKYPRKLAASAECYLKRAVRLYPKDSSVYYVYGIHLHRIELYKQAIVMYKHALKLDSSYPGVHYNVGLAYIKLGDVVNAKKHAKIAKNKGYNLPGLQRLIKKYETEKKKTPATK